jgi:hypothetical protein
MKACVAGCVRAQAVTNKRKNSLVFTGNPLVFRDGTDAAGNARHSMRLARQPKPVVAIDVVLNEFVERNAPPAGWAGYFRQR